MSRKMRFALFLFIGLCACSATDEIVDDTSATSGGNGGAAAATTSADATSSSSSSSSSGGTGGGGGAGGGELAMCEVDNCPAFPGAEGEGMFAKGGRGGDVCHVTDLGSSGAGTLRDCVSNGSGPRTVVFDTGGIIDLTSRLRIDRSQLTLAGQTAPGDGITIRGYQVEVYGDDNIIQHLRFRPGDIRKKTENSNGFTEDSLTISGKRIIVDHVSASWGIDENLSTGSDWDQVTVQYAIIAEGLYHTELFHGEWDPDHHGHSMGSLFKPKTGDAAVSIHHNLFANNENRNPGIGAYETDQVLRADIRNNVIYNCPRMGYTSGVSQRIELNYVANYAVFGPASNKDYLFQGREGANLEMFQQGNHRDTNRNGQFDGSDGGLDLFDGVYVLASSAFAMAPVTTHSATEAIDIVRNQAGARPWNRDATDARIVASMLSDGGAVIDSQDQVGGWGSVDEGATIVDGDRDGMPDAWETTYGTDPSTADNNGDIDGNGYTNLEDYLHAAM